MMYLVYEAARRTVCYPCGSIRRWTYLSALGVRNQVLLLPWHQENNQRYDTILHALIERELVDDFSLYQLCRNTNVLARGRLYIFLS